jgi:predicted NUDIX family NTP pyrophosphohydrolase
MQVHGLSLKGNFLVDEDALIASKREFLEETGQAIDGDFIQLQAVKLKSGKTIHAWAIEGNVDETNIISNIFPFEWPPKSGKMIDIPEVDKGDWFSVEIAKQKINQAQVALIDQLIKILI